jgi:type IX secretion system PorP/SprF family membrane protein
MKKNSIYICLLFSIKLFSQDIFFSQTNFSNMLVNPALISVNSDLEASIICREQWPSITNKPYKTLGASVETKLKPRRWKELEKQKGTFMKSRSFNAVGLCFYHDNAGNAKLSQDIAYLGFNQSFKLAQQHYVFFGIQAGINYLKAGNLNVSYPNQFTAAGYDPNLPSNEVFQTSQRVMFDCGAGINYVIKKAGTSYANEENKFIFGFSAFHINRPFYSFIQNDKLNVRYNINMTYSIDLKNSNLTIFPTFNAYFQGAQKNIQGGAIFRYKLSDNSHYTGFKQSAFFSIGCQYRYQDALCFPIKIDIKNYSVGFNYDLNISPLLRSSKSIGALEICLSFHTSNPHLYQNKK